MKKQDAIERADLDFTAADENLRGFERGESEFKCPHCRKVMSIDNEDILKPWRNLVALRTAALDHALSVARKYGAAICGMKPVASADRVYDKQLLWDSLENDEALRDMIFETKLTVRSAEFDRAVQMKNISPELRDKVVTRDRVKYTLREQPKKIVLG